MPNPFDGGQIIITTENAFSADAPDTWRCRVLPHLLNSESIRPDSFWQLHLQIIPATPLLVTHYTLDSYDT
jgi:hypothetical protein